MSLVDLGQIFSFVLSRKEQDMDFVGHYKTQKAYSYYQSGFVDTIYFTSLNGTKVVKSRVSQLKWCFGFPCEETSGYQLLFATST
jgi:hypothetical protein